MKKQVKALLAKVGQDSYGPKKSNPIYRVKDKKGDTWTVKRHQWSHPTTSWGWKAQREVAGMVESKYSDTIPELLSGLGYTWAEMGEG